MKKIILVLTVVLLASIFSMSAFAANEENKEKNLVLKLGMGELGFETKITGNYTFVGGVGIAYDFHEEAFSNWFGAAVRYYYNLEKLKNKGERINKFAADYVTLEYKRRTYPFLGDDISNAHFIGIGWGFQRNLGKVFQYGIEGLWGVNFQDHSGKLHANVNVFFGLAM